MFRDSMLYDFLTEAVPVTVAIIGCITLIVVAIYSATSPMSCRAYGEKMVIETSWGFWTGCMINIRGQWLPSSEVVPVERDGRITFEPKPYVRLAPPAESK